MRPVADAMTSVPILEASTTIQDASAAMLDDHVEAAVIVDGARLRGLVTASDVATALAEGRDAGSTPVASVCSCDPALVERDEPLAEARHGMRAADHALGVVIGDEGRPVGLLADDAAAL
jgi:CBS domain-containing protein